MIAPFLMPCFRWGMGCNTCLLEPGLEPNTWEYRTERGGHCWYRTVWIWSFRELNKIYWCASWSTASSQFLLITGSTISEWNWTTRFPGSTVADSQLQAYGGGRNYAERAQEDRRGFRAGLSLQSSRSHRKRISTESTTSVWIRH